MYLLALAASVGNPAAPKGNQILLLDELGKDTKNNYSLNTSVHLFCKSRHICRHGKRWSDSHDSNWNAVRFNCWWWGKGEAEFEMCGPNLLHYS